MAKQQEKEPLTEDQIEEIKKCSESFHYFTKNYVKILHPTRGLIPLELYGFQDRLINDYEAHSYNMTSKFRQAGVTTVTTIWLLWRCMFKCDQQVLVVCKTDREAKTTIKIVKRVMQYLPEWLMPPILIDNTHEIQFSQTDSYMGFFTPEAARGRSMTYLVIDEAAFIPNMEEHWKALYPVLSAGGRCIAISTVNGMGNWYEQEYHKAIEGQNNFHIIDLDYREHPDYNNAQWEKNMRAQLTDKGWRQEFLKQFTGTGNTYISPDIIGEMEIRARKNKPIRKLFPEYDGTILDASISPINEEFEKGALWIWQEPIVNREYLIACDVAEGIGEDGDNSAFHVLDLITNEQVAEFCSNLIAPHILAQVLDQVGQYYNTAQICIENNGPGFGTLQKLIHFLNYPNIYQQDAKANYNNNKMGVTVNRTSRASMMDSMRAYLTNNMIKINSIRLVKELNTFKFNPSTKRPEAQRGKHDDLILSLALMLMVKDTLYVNMPVGFEKIAGISAELTGGMNHDLHKSIKATLEEGATDAWLAINSLNDNDDGIMDGEESHLREMIKANIAKRPFDALLKEFSWSLIPFCLLFL